MSLLRKICYCFFRTNDPQNQANLDDSQDQSFIKNPGVKDESVRKPSPNVKQLTMNLPPVCDTPMRTADIWHEIDKTPHSSTKNPNIASNVQSKVIKDLDRSITELDKSIENSVNERQIIKNDSKPIINLSKVIEVPESKEHSSNNDKLFSRKDKLKKLGKPGAIVNNPKINKSKFSIENNIKEHIS